MATLQQVAQQPPTANGKQDRNGSIAGARGSPQQNQNQNQSPSTGPVQHRRVYQACIPCRKRKVKCDLGPVDNPRPGPCVRCLRESKACYFSDTRRKQKLDENDEPIYDPDFVDRNARKRTISDRGESEVPDIRTFGPYRDTPLAPVTPGRVAPYSAVPLNRPGHTSKSNSWHQPQPQVVVDEDSGRVMTNPEAQSTMRTEIFSNHDAMNLLVKAATDPTEPSASNVNKRAKLDGSGMLFPTRNVQYSGGGQNAGPNHIPHQANSSPYRPTYRDDYDLANRQNEPGYKSAVKAWSEFNLVKLKWFTPEEAIGYIDYYYKYLSPLTPISPPTFQNLSTHGTLIQDDPVLVVTLLTIASRYYILPPSSGGFARSFDIHDRLWARLRKMVERCLWGQESFGGGSGSTDWEANSSTAPWRGLRRGSLRTLGTVESLMILTEWHPRGLHFPPRDAEYEVVPPTYPVQSFEDKNQGAGGKKFESWLEPAWRSDRMCWMLLSIAQGLSYELGVFDQNDDENVGGDRARPEYNEEAYRLRAERIKKLLLIYITQLSGRLGWTNMVTMSEKDSLPSMGMRLRGSMDGNTPGTNSSLINSFNYIPDLELDDQIIHCWAGITSAMRRGNDTIFRSRKYTTDIIKTGKYHALLDSMAPVLSGWKKNFDNYQLPHYIRHILTIEYEYVRIYINSLSLQAVVERSTAQQVSIYDSTDADGKYVKEVVDASRNLLRTVVEGLLPNDYLKHAPVRTYFRIISGAMFLLKTFALGASKSDIDVSIGLMDSTVKALRDCVVDDVHLGTRFADLLQTLTTRLRTRFMHVPLGAENAMTTQLQNDQQNQTRENGQDGGQQDWEAQMGSFDENTQHFSASAFDLPADSSLYPLFYPLDPTNPPTGLATPNTNHNNPNLNMPSDWAGSAGGNAGGASNNQFDQDMGGVGGAYVFPDPRGAEFFQNAHQEDAYVGEYDWMMEAIPLGVQPEQFRG